MNNNVPYRRRDNFTRLTQAIAIALPHWSRQPALQIAYYYYYYYYFYYYYYY